jgi:hypothetical protein
MNTKSQAESRLRKTLRWWVFLYGWALLWLGFGVGLLFWSRTFEGISYPIYLGSYGVAGAPWFALSASWCDWHGQLTWTWSVICAVLSELLALATFYLAVHQSLLEYFGIHSVIGLAMGALFGPLLKLLTGATSRA